MPNVNPTESTSPPEGGNVEDVYAKVPKTNPSDVTEISFTSTNQSNSATSVSKKLTNTRKGLGITSTSFIGPACRPEPPSIEQELNDFYKELEEVDSSDQVDEHKSCKPERSVPLQKDTPVVETDHSRAYRPYPDPHTHGGHQWQHPNRWRPRTQCGTESFGKSGHLDPWYPPPPWIPQGPSNSDFEYFPPPPSGGPMYLSDMRPQQNFHSYTNNSNWAPWEESRLPPNEWHDRRQPSHEFSRYSEEYETSNWQENNHKEDQYHHYDSTLRLILLRGLPGSGKSSLARELMSSGPNGTILSTDDYFFKDNTYVFDGTLLGDAHDWNQMRAERAMSEGRSPVIIDNTNIKAWEMKPYVEMALMNRYEVDFREPETNWKYDPAELAKRNKHGVPQETIEKMLDRFEGPVNIDIVMNSAEPPHKTRGQ